MGVVAVTAGGCESWASLSCHRRESPCRWQVSQSLDAAQVTGTAREGCLGTHDCSPGAPRNTFVVTREATSRVVGIL